MTEMNSVSGDSYEKRLRNYTEEAIQLSSNLETEEQQKNLKKARRRLFKDFFPDAMK
jgi:hypothetical protein